MAITIIPIIARPSTVLANNTAANTPPIGARSDKIAKAGEFLLRLSVGERTIGLVNEIPRSMGVAICAQRNYCTA